MTPVDRMLNSAKPSSCRQYTSSGEAGAASARIPSQVYGWTCSYTRSADGGIDGARDAVEPVAAGDVVADERSSPSASARGDAAVGVEIGQRHRSASNRMRPPAARRAAIRSRTTSFWP